MIPSKGTNQYPDNRFAFWSWSAPILQKPEEVLQTLKSLRLEGRVVKDVIAIGMGYNMTGDSLCDWLYHVYENLHPILQNQITEEAAFEDPHICLSRRAELDEPLLIVFEDGDVLGISFDEGSCVRAELNTIPVSIQPGINYKNFHANRLFQDIIGKTVVAFSVTATTLEPDFTWSHGLNLEEQESYVESVCLIYADEAGWQPHHRKLRFQADLDFGEVTLMDYDDTAVKLPVTELPYILEGFPDAEYFRK